MAYQGEAAAARAAAEAALEGAAELGGRYVVRRARGVWDSRPWPPGMLAAAHEAREAARQ